MDEEEPKDEMQFLLDELIEEDVDHIKGAMNKLIDPISKWINLNSTAESLTANDLMELLDALAYAQFTIHGIMYGYGLGVECDHEDDENEDD